MHIRCSCSILHHILTYIPDVTTAATRMPLCRDFLAASRDFDSGKNCMFAAGACLPSRTKRNTDLGINSTVTLKRLRALKAPHFGGGRSAPPILKRDARLSMSVGSTTRRASARTGIDHRVLFLLQRGGNFNDLFQVHYWK
jgi:hypothetical protein